MGQRTIKSESTCRISGKLTRNGPKTQKLMSKWVKISEKMGQNLRKMGQNLRKMCQNGHKTDVLCKIKKKSREFSAKNVLIFSQPLTNP